MGIILIYIWSWFHFQLLGFRFSLFRKITIFLLILFVLDQPVWFWRCARLLLACVYCWNVISEVLFIWHIRFLKVRSVIHFSFIPILRVKRVAAIFNVENSFVKAIIITILTKTIFELTFSLDAFSIPGFIKQLRIILLYLPRKHTLIKTFNSIFN